MDRSENPLRDQLVQPTFEAIDGYVATPQTPGLGVDVNLEVLHAFTRVEP